MLEGCVSWPPAVAGSYRRKGYWSGTLIGDAFAASADRHQNRIAVVDGDRRFTYRELHVLVTRFSLHLLDQGIRSGDRAVFHLPNGAELAVGYMACLTIGAIPVAGLPAHRRAESQHLLAASGASAWLIPAEHRGFDFVAMAEEILADMPGVRRVFVADAVRPEVAGDRFRDLAQLLADPIEARVPVTELARSRPDPGACAVFQLSGGTTGKPKIIPRTHDDYLFNSLAFARASAFDATSVLLLGLPAAHNFPLACPGLQGALLLGARVVFAPSPAPERLLELIERERVTWIPTVPAVAMALTEAARTSNRDLTSLRTIAVGGQRLNPEPARALIDCFGPVLCQVYGMAEGLLCCTRADDPLDVVLRTQGRPICDDDEIRIVDAGGNDVADGELGELLCRGPYTIRGYYRADEHNAAAFTADGFYRTGDLVRLHSSGNLIVEGRNKDVINRGGEKVGAEEIEDHLLSHSAVANAAVVAMPDQILGERLCAFAVLRAGTSLELGELRAYLRDVRKIANHKLPDRLELRERLPMTAVGKVAKTELRAEIAALVKSC